MVAAVRRTVLAAVAAGAAVVALTVVPAGVSAAAAGDAPGAPGQASTWAEGDKDGFGTAYGTSSKVWYTLNDGTDEKTFTDREDRDSTHVVQLVSPTSLTYRVVNTAKSGKWRITKTFTTDPARASVLENVTFESLTGQEYQVYLLHDPALSMT